MGTTEPVNVGELDERAVAGLSMAFAPLFASWGRPVAVFASYLDQHRSGARVCFVGHLGSKPAGFVTLRLRSPYPPFASQGIPEISDLNVLPNARRQGLGSSLLDAAESAAKNSGAAIVGLGVGLYADYGAAQRIYVRRGYLPDGRGVM